MQISNFLVLILIAIIIWNSFLSGVSYNASEDDARLRKASIGRMLLSLIISVFVLFIIWR